MNTETETQSRFQTLRIKLPDLERRIVTEMSLVFGTSRHELWTGETYHASSLRFDELKEVRKKGFDNLDDRDINWLMFCVMTTIGSQETIKFLLPRFFAAYFSKPDYGWTAEPLVIVNRLERADFDAWPDVERKPVLEAVILAAQHEIDRGRDYDFVSEYDTEALQWAQIRLKQIS